MPKLRSDKLDVRVYARHGDTCGLAPHCQQLRCASGRTAEDYVLSAAFAYLQEAIDYAQMVARRGVRARLVSRIVPAAPYARDYVPEAMQAEYFEQSVTLVDQNGNVGFPRQPQPARVSAEMGGDLDCTSDADPGL